MKISLTKRAEKNYRSIKEYIANEWGEPVSDAFEQKTVDFLDLLEDFPELLLVADQQSAHLVFSSVPTLAHYFLAESLASATLPALISLP